MNTGEGMNIHISAVINAITQAEVCLASVIDGRGSLLAGADIDIVLDVAENLCIAEEWIKIGIDNIALFKEALAKLVSELAARDVGSSPAGILK